MGKTDKYLQERIQQINERIDSIIKKATEDLTEEELSYIKLPQYKVASFFIALSQNVC
ncbi:MAG: nitric oxide synthase oxygenase [Desulfobacterales bacterium]|nr:nitric oxide synthase oxygenase [Desulfobacterales bacterium]